MGLEKSNYTASETAWLTLTDEEYEHALSKGLFDLCDDWNNPEDGEYRIINPHSRFYTVALFLGIEVY